MEQIISRIKKLFQHAESAKSFGSLEEAETFLKKANDLLLQYNLELSAVLSAKDQSNKFKDWKYAEEVSYQDNQSGSRWRYNLIDILATYNFCSIVYYPSIKTFRVYGNMYNVDQVIWMYHFVGNGLLRLAQQSHIEYKNQSRFEIRPYNRYAYLKDFMLGAVKGIHQKLENQRQEQIRNSNQVQSLMIVNKNALQEYQKEIAPNIKSARKQKVVYVGEAYREGIKAGLNYNIAPPLEQKQEQQKLN